jgi:thioredoxin-related protein
MVLKTTKPYKLNPIFSKISIDPDSIQEILDALCHPTWMTDYDTALHEANQQHTLVLTAFTGYNWCSYCQALEQEVFNTCEFGMWTISKNLILL